MRVLICGHRASSALGLVKLLEGEGWEVDCFSRGTSGRHGNVVEGDVLTLSSNIDLNSEYDAVINFIVLKGETSAPNVEFARELVKFCNTHNVRSLIQISSISVYSADHHLIDESTPIAPQGVIRGAYSTLKTEVDHELISAEKRFALALVRPGLILDSSIESPRAGIVKSLPFMHVLLGDAATTLPTVQRSVVQLALARLLAPLGQAGVFIVVSKPTSTKLEYAKKTLGLRPIRLPRSVTLFAAQVLHTLGIFSEPQLLQVKGLFRASQFDPTGTEGRLGMEFK